MVGYLKRLTRLANLIQIRQRKKGNIEVNGIGDKKRRHYKTLRKFRELLAHTLKPVSYNNLPLPTRSRV